MHEKILALLNQATPSQIQAGMCWYSEAATIADAIDEPRFRTIGALAALSPRNKWHRNIKDTAAVYLDGRSARVATFGACREKAVQCFRADSPAEVESILGGRKTISFFNNILDPTVPYVTVDVWMWRACGFLEPGNNMDYTEIEQIVVTIAEHVKIHPCQLQAILWNVAREGWNGNTQLIS